MALIRSTVLSSIRGSINGTTYSQNRYGAYARNRTVPVNPRTDAQQNVRAALTQSSQAWRALSNIQRETWNAYAAATPVTNRLGETITLSGQAMFNKYQTFARFAGVTVPTAPPLTPGLALTLSIADAQIYDAGSAEPDSLQVTEWANGDNTANSVYTFAISGPQSAGTTFFKGPWTTVSTLTGATRGNAITLPFAPLLGQFFFIRVRYRDVAGKIGNDVIFGPIAVSNVP